MARDISLSASSRHQTASDAVSNYHFPLTVEANYSLIVQDPGSTSNITVIPRYDVASKSYQDKVDRFRAGTADAGQVLDLGHLGLSRIGTTAPSDAQTPASRPESTMVHMRLGESGFGKVYHAWDVSTGRDKSSTLVAPLFLSRQKLRNLEDSLFRRCSPGKALDSSCGTVTAATVVRARDATKPRTKPSSASLVLAREPDGPQEDRLSEAPIREALDKALMDMASGPETCIGKGGATLSVKRPMAARGAPVLEALEHCRLGERTTTMTAA
ncbi:hypothetical protein MAPG_10862 [Magnaporthiopsis poae ATCC 64411]|uniref:Uncharacterized protein n=1 Tax=Magnaporthiopsis poae (strain ATCC 64411 / 73-15) TaxID=644358 RepID=A0A0C4EDQ4_MAGP6|nr:hypothetical protein MAPG_10862 [Magnaporthiopsis poae ATCC 64411]